MSDLKPVKVNGELFWSKWMNEFNTKFNEENKKYECTIGMLSDAAAEALKAIGIKIKEKEGMGKYIVGKSLYVFEPVTKEGHKVDIEDIGNGSKVVALVASYRHKMSAMHGAAPSIKKLIVTEVKTYVADGEVAPEGDDDDKDVL